MYLAVECEKSSIDIVIFYHLEVIAMKVIELLPQLRQLSRTDKLYAMQFLISELAQEEKDLLKADLDYPIWSPYDAFEAADTMLEVLKAAKTDHDAW